MTDSAWRGRLEAAITASGRSMREVSLSAGMAAGYLHSIIHDNREPGIERMMKLADELGISVTYLLVGSEMTTDTEQLLRVYATLPPEQKAALLALAKSMAPKA